MDRWGYGGAMKRRACTLLAAAVLTAACSDNPGGGATAGTGGITVPDNETTAGPTTTAPTELVLSALDGPGLTGQDAELAALRVGNGGRLPADAALDLFAAGMDGVPGADPDRFEPDDDLTMALRAVLANWDEYDAEQQAAVQSVLGYPVAQGFRATSANGPRTTSILTLQSQVDAAAAEIGTRMGHTLSVPISATTVPGLAHDGHPVNGLTWPERAGVQINSGQMDRCVVHLADGATDRTVVHEVFHCFQMDVVADVAEAGASEDWLMEGSATWAAAQIAAVDDRTNVHYEIWAMHLDSLFVLDYAGVGFFYALDDMGLSPWRVVPAMIGKTGLEAVAATGAEPAAVLTYLAPIITRAHTFAPIPVSASWDYLIDAPTWAERTDITISPGDGFERSLPGGNFAKGAVVHATVEDATRVRVLMDADVGTLEFFEQSSPITWSQRFGREFCIQPGGCTCGASGERDSGLAQGGPDLIVAPGQLGAGPMNYRIEVPDEVFSDGTWRGTITASVLNVSNGVASGERLASTFPFELTVENGAITSGVFTIGFQVQASSPSGSGSGLLSIGGAFAGCGFAPQLKGLGLSFDGTMIIGESDIPVTFSNPIDGGESGLETVWLPNPITNPNTRTGALDAGGTMESIAAGGFSVNDLRLTFEATRTD